MPRTTTSSQSKRAVVATTLTCLWLATAAASATAADTPDFGPDSHKHFITRVNQAQSTDYRAVLDLYEQQRLSDPDDIVSQIERCRFIETFAYSEGATIDSASDDLETCRADLASSPHKGDVEVILYKVESASWNDEGFNAAKALIPASKAWTDLQRSRLYEFLAQRARMKDEAAGGDFAILAVNWNPGSSALPQALDRWKQLGSKHKIRQAIIAAPESAWNDTTRAHAAETLIDIGDAEMAARFLQDHPGEKTDNSGLVLARALAASGEFKEAARKYREEIAAKTWIPVSSRLEYFEFELAHGNEKDALAAYEAMRTAYPDVDVLGRYRLNLVATYPHLIWAWETGRALLAILAIALLVCLVPAVVIVPIHYRGLARRVRGLAPDSAGAGWRLRHAWYASAVFLLASTAAVYFLVPSVLAALMPWTGYMPVTPPSSRDLAKATMWSAIGAALLLLPLLRGQPLKALLLGSWSIKRSVLTGLGLAIFLKFIAVLAGVGYKSSGALGSDTTRMIQGAYDAYGLPGMLLTLGVLVPLVEEFIFRGVLLKAFRGQVSFLLATLVQATAFTLMHEEREAMIFLFLFALVAAWLVKRSEGLLASIVMHSVNNLTAGLAIIGMTLAMDS